MDKIIALDNRFNEGNVEEAYYHNKRKQLKAQLKNVMGEEQAQG
jgi:hypothetical protein